MPDERSDGPGIAGLGVVTVVLAALDLPESATVWLSVSDARQLGLALVRHAQRAMS